jgi:antitoxin component YwqK of YwqJK toxin-antitoxin module
MRVGGKIDNSALNEPITSNESSNDADLFSHNTSAICDGPTIDPIIKNTVGGVEGAITMSWSERRWTLRLALSVSLATAASLAQADNTPTLAKTSATGPQVTHPVVTQVEPIPVTTPLEAAPLTSEESADAAAEDSGAGIDVIRERFPDSKVKIERHVTQDAEGNFYNHGLWTQWDEKGRLVGSGEYRYGKRNGRWNRWYGSTEAAMLNGPLYKDFVAPFAAEATFEDGVLHGVWTIYDSKNHKVCEWSFDHGDRSGKSVWYYPNGQKRREVDYRANEIDGEIKEWGSDNKVVVSEKYIDGRRLAPQVDYYSPGQKRDEGWILYGREITKANYDFWNGVATIQVVGTDGPNQRQGLWTWWHQNGQKKMEGRYEADQPTGKFTWWYATGQKQLEGEYISGKQQGKFTWWHPNGQKQLEGAYIAGVLSGKWSRWNVDGRVVEVGDYSADGKQIVQEPRPLPPSDDSGNATVEAMKPAPPASSARLKR